MPHATWDASRVFEGFGYRAFTCYGVIFQSLLLPSPIPCRGPATPTGKPVGLACSLFDRLYWGNPFRFLFLEVLRCFSSLGIASCTYVFSTGYPGITPGGLSHSEIFGSKFVCNSPKHIAAYHVLHRLSLPSHPS